MKISKSKQELARIISENGGWRDGAKLAVFGPVSRKVRFSRHHEKPVILHKSRGLGQGWEVAGQFDSWMKSESIHVGKPFPNWHQTILSRAEYFHLYPVPDADGWIKRDENGIISIEYNKDKQEAVAPGELDANGWIEWRGGGCPVERGVMVDIKDGYGREWIGVKALDSIECDHYFWVHASADSKENITAYRLHKPEQAKPEFCESVMRSIPEPETKPSIEQLAADYRNAKDFAERKQQEADAAKDDAKAKLKALELAGEALGLLVSPITAKQEPELVITDWRDLRVGDEVECVKVNKTGDNYADEYIGKLGVVIKTEPPMLANQAVRLRFCDGKEYWISEWRFIRRQ